MFYWIQKNRSSIQYFSRWLKHVKTTNQKMSTISICYFQGPHGHRFGIMTMPPRPHWASPRYPWSQCCKVTWQRETMESSWPCFPPKKWWKKNGMWKLFKVAGGFSKIAKNMWGENGWIWEDPSISMKYKRESNTKLFQHNPWIERNHCISWLCIG